MPATKRELFIRLASLVYRMRHVNATSVLLEMDLASVEGDLTRIEEELARQIDDYQAGLYGRYNNAGAGDSRAEEDPNGLSGIWNRHKWNRSTPDRRYGT